jgi:AcrR family transcriptional regulator
MARGRRNVDAALLSSLACGATFEVAAQRAGVSPATVTRRMGDRKFRKLLNQTIADIVQRTANALTAAATEAVRALLDLLKPSVAPSIRLNAARAVLELGPKSRESSDLLQRVMELEERLAARS